MFDIAIIGAGIVGSSIAYELSKYNNLKICIIEKENDVSNVTTKANSAIIHAGYDPLPGTLMAKLNVRGNEIIRSIVSKLDIPYKQTGSLVLAFDEKDKKEIINLLNRGIENGVEGIRIIKKDELKSMEPNLSDDVKEALYAPTAGIINPWEFALALAETAVRNGVKILLNSKVTSINIEKDGYKININSKRFVISRFVINAAGVNADEVHKLVSNQETFKINPDRGEYYLLDKSQGNKVTHVVFQCPTKKGKGTLIAPTVHGNLIVGPNSEFAEDKENVKTTREGLREIALLAKKSVPNINLGDCIRNFAGIRANSNKSDFIIEEVESVPNFYDIAGIKSPGLTAAPAIAEMIIEILGQNKLRLKKKKNFINTRKRIKFKELTLQEKAKLIKKCPSFGRIVCRCETITEGEVLETFKTPIPPVSVDGVKRRCNPGMGRCQGGFCGPTIVDIISKNLNIPQTQVLLDKKGTEILLKKTKEED